jgi:nucleoside-diphosphate-sugar epimerase
MKTALVCGAGGFIGNHLVNRLKNEGYWVRGVDLKEPEFQISSADQMIIGDLREKDTVELIFDKKFDEVYQLAADMGGWLHVFSGNYDAEIMHNSSMINLNVAKYASLTNAGRLFYSSSACIYPGDKQEHLVGGLKESDAFPAYPDSPYGWEKIFSEIVYECFSRNYGLDIRIARFHNIFGPNGTYDGGRQKAPADICRQVAKAEDGGSITLNGDGTGVRSFLYIAECIEGIRRLMNSDYKNPLNIGSDEGITINQLAETIISLSGKNLSINYIPCSGMGVKQRNSDNTLIEEVLGWRPTKPVSEGLAVTYKWINEQCH